MDEQEAIQRLKDGDIRGLEALVHRHQVRAVRTAYLITRDSGLAEDIVQDAFIRAYHAIGGFDAARPFEPWFLQIVINAAVKMMQKSTRQVGLDDEAGEALLAEIAARDEPVEAQVALLEVQHQVWDAMSRLSPRQRAVIVQRYFLGMSEAEMAHVSGTAPGTIKWLAAAARERLRTLLAEWGLE